jgi:calcineurin-like phosphoesterase family protein
MPYFINKEEKHHNYKIIDDGKWLLHGHIHHHYLKYKKMINVGVDVWNFKPVSIEQIKQLFY